MEIDTEAGQEFVVDLAAAAESADEKVKKLATSVELNAQFLIHIVFPTKILELDKFYKEIAERGQDKFQMTGQGAPVNLALVTLLTRMKHELIFMLRCMDVLKVWVQLHIPRIQDGNNFGVGIQEEIVGLLQGGRQASMAALDISGKYYVSRGKLVSKLLKHPDVVDYERSVEELDDKEWISLRNSCVDIRNNYAILYDTIIKNLAKLKRPRGSSSHESSLY